MQLTAVSPILIERLEQHPRQVVFRRHGNVCALTHASGRPCRDTQQPFIGTYILLHRHACVSNQSPIQSAGTFTHREHKDTAAPNAGFPVGLGCIRHGQPTQAITIAPVANHVNWQHGRSDSFAGVPSSEDVSRCAVYTHFDCV